MYNLWYYIGSWSRPFFKTFISFEINGIPFVEKFASLSSVYFGVQPNVAMSKSSNSNDLRTELAELVKRKSDIAVSFPVNLPTYSMAHTQN